jgi:hypothetical protein
MEERVFMHIQVEDRPLRRIEGLMQLEVEEKGVLERNGWRKDYYDRVLN